MADFYHSVHELSMSGVVLPEFVRAAKDQPGAGTTTSRGGSGLEVPVVDMSKPDCGVRMADAATNWGSFQVVNHGVPEEVVAKLQSSGRAFFALPQEEKERYATNQASKNVEGYGVGIRAPRRNLEGRKMWADYLYHYVAPPTMVNQDIWPKNPAGYREANEEYCRHMQRLSREMFEHLSAGLGLEQNAMRDAFGGGELVLLQKINSYPPCPRPDIVLGVGPHTDMCTLTILLPDEVLGLQVFNDGLWYDVNYIPGALIVLIADQIEILSNGRYKAGLHRAMVNKDKTRMSWPVFVEPPGEVVVSPHQQLTTDDSPVKYKTKKYKDYQYCKVNHSTCCHSEQVRPVTVDMLSA